MAIHLENELVSQYIDELLESMEFPLLDRIIGLLNNGVKIQIWKTLGQRKKDGDCRDYAFEYLGLPQYKYPGGINNFKLTSKLRNNELPEFSQTNEFSIGVLVAYFCKGEYGENYMHYGLCVGFEDDIPIIESLWGEHGLVARHHVGSVATYQGDHVELYEM